MDTPSVGRGGEAPEQVKNEMVILRKQRDEIREIVNEQVREVLREELGQWTSQMAAQPGPYLTAVLQQPGQTGVESKGPGASETLVMDSEDEPAAQSGVRGEEMHDKRKMPVRAVPVQAVPVPAVPVQGFASGGTIAPSRAQVQALEQAENQLMQELRLNLQKLRQAIVESQEIAQKIQEVLRDERAQGKGRS